MLGIEEVLRVTIESNDGAAVITSLLVDLKDLNELAEFPLGDGLQGASGRLASRNAVRTSE